MSIIFELNGPDIPRSAVVDVCEALGYDPNDVSSINIPAATQKVVIVETFVRVPVSGMPHGIKPLVTERAGYAKARITHTIVPNKASTEESL